MPTGVQILSKNHSYNSVDDKDVLSFIAAIKKGIAFKSFQKITEKCPFSLSEWAEFLHISERTMQRYKKELKTFDSLQSEKILQITLLYSTGVNVFGEKTNFDTWLESPNVALSKLRPKDLLDNAFGIRLLSDELTRIEHGVLA